MDDAVGKFPASVWLDPRIELRESPLGGSGLFAAQPVRAGEPVIVWGGPSYTDEAGAREAARARKARKLPAQARPRKWAATS